MVDNLNRAKTAFSENTYTLLMFQYNTLSHFPKITVELYKVHTI